MTAGDGCGTVGDMVDDVCSAIGKLGERTLICELKLGHLKEGQDHAMGEVTWPEPSW